MFEKILVLSVLFIKSNRCSTLMLNAVSDLINRQRAETERLLQKLQQAKSEAIKEFAKRLKEKCYEDFQETYEMLSPYVTDDDIDDLVKEMIEEK